MEYKTNYRYFHKRMYPLFVGIALAIIGYLNVFYGFFVDSWFLYNMFVVLMVLGLIMILFFFVSSVKESELDKGVKTRIRDIVQTATDKATAADKHARIMDNYVAESYIFGKDVSTELKKGRDGTFRSNYYSASAFLISASKLFVYTVSFSLTESNETESFCVYTYNAIDGICLKDDVINAEIGNKAFTIDTHTIDIKSGDSLTSYPTHNDSLADNMISMVLNRKEKCEADKS